MTILRSREIVAVETLKKQFMDDSASSKLNEPSTPNSSPSRKSHCSVQNQSMDADMPDSGSLPGSDSNLRRSRRIASRLTHRESSTEVAASGGRRKRKDASEVNRLCSVEGKCESGSGSAEGRVLGSDSVGKEEEVLEVREGVETTERGLRGLEIREEEEVKELSVGLGSDLGSFVERTQTSEDMATLKRSKGKRKLSVDTSLLDAGDKEFLGLRSGKKIAKEIKVLVHGIDSDGGRAAVEQACGGEDKGGLKAQSDGNRNGDAVVEELEKNPCGNENGSVVGRRRFTAGEKGKSKLVEDSEPQNSIDAKELDLSLELKNAIKSMNTDEKDDVKDRQIHSREEKGKGILINDDLAPNGVHPVELNLESEVKNSVDSAVSVSVPLEGNVRLQVSNEVIQSSMTGNASRARTRFRDIARRNASRFAHFEPEIENNPSGGVEIQRPSEEGEKGDEDWPGPFSTAMKIIKDREKNLNTQQNSGSNQNRTVHVIWSPREDKSTRPKPSAPLLQEMCLEVLAQNSDAITSLENIPDSLRHKLSKLLCDSRKMNGHILELLVCGSPSEVRVRDCSWLTEEEFSRIFKECDTSSLTVLQLDQCGRCMTDYILRAPFNLLSNSLPALTTVSLKGACRLSDVGLRVLVSSAPTLRSINLSQCSLLTYTSIETLAETLGSVLRELYIDDCQGIDAMLILPALQKLEYLEVLSVAGIQTICDEFIWELISLRGPTMKELVLTDCSRLTDLSLKAIAETCTELRALDLGNLCKLTDSAFRYLASGCKAIQTLKLRCNSFSDEAVAAFLEISGRSLIELSLNNVSKVDHNTAMSLARRSRELIRLDLSWCRNLTDEDLGFIVDSCLSLRVLKLFGCTQITNTFLDGHSNPQVQIIGLKMTPILEHLKLTDSQSFPLKYSFASM